MFTSLFAPSLTLRDPRQLLSSIMVELWSEKIRKIVFSWVSEHCASLETKKWLYLVIYCDQVSKKFQYKIYYFSKYKNRKIVFAYVSENCASFGTKKIVTHGDILVNFLKLKVQNRPFFIKIWKLFLQAFQNIVHVLG